MKIHRLEVEGFGPFRQRQTVDFDEVSRDGLFLIAGKTGAGKSSILDAVCFALYGSVPRYEDGDRRLRSDHATLDEPTRVLVEFTAAGSAGDTGGKHGPQKWRIERSPSYERLKKNGKGTTSQPATARLARWEDGEWRDIAARAVDVAHELDAILGLSREQFLQVILLAQGRFQRFLHAQNDERQKLLRTLFGSHRFLRYEQALDERRKEALERRSLLGQTLLLQIETAEKRVAAAGGTVEETAELAARLAAMQTASLHAAHEAEVAEVAAEAAGSARDEADAVCATLLAQREKQQRRDAARQREKELDARAEAITADRDALARALDAEALRAAIDAVDRTEAARAAAVSAEEDARSACTADGAGDLGVDEAATDGALAARIDDLVTEAGRLGDASRDEQALERTVADLAAAETAVTVARARRDDLEKERGALPSALAAVGERIAAAEVHAATLDSATARVAEAESRAAAATEALKLAGSLAHAEQIAADAGRALTAASAALDDLRERRFADHAGELAELLVEGEPCSVCGSITHPHPAVRHAEPVGPDDIAAAQQAKDAALAADAAATAAEKQARAAHADAVVRAGGIAPEAAELEVSAARAARQVAAEALAELDRCRVERADLEQRLDRAEVDAAQAAQAIADAEHARTVAEQNHRQTQERIVQARAGFDTVAARLAAVTAHLQRTRAWALARADRIVREREAAEARTALHAQLEPSPFDSAADATAALLPASDRAVLDARLREYDADRASTRQNLFELEIDALPEEPVDTAGAEQHRAAARERWASAMQSATTARRHAADLAADVSAAAAAAETGAAAAAEIDTIEQLASAVSGRAHNTKKMDLETFVLAGELERIVEAANARLTEMSDGRYLLQHSDALAAHGRASGLGITIMDRNTGQSRPVQSLSGGETFLASLALALGLAQVVTADAGGVSLDTLFIDEGFGSLDAETLEIAMSTLDELRAGGRTVGVISHVEAMQATLPAGIVVEATPQGPSVIRQP